MLVAVWLVLLAGVGAVKLIAGVLKSTEKITVEELMLPLESFAYTVQVLEP
jgi:hypothetical protein